MVESGLCHLLTQRLQKGLVLGRRPAQDQSVHVEVMRQHFEHRIDEYVGAFLAADAPEATDGEALGQAEGVPLDTPVCGGTELGGVDAVRYYL